MLTGTKLDAQIADWREQEAENPVAAQATPDLLTVEQRFLRALAQGASWEGGRLPLSFQPSPYQVRVKDSNLFAASALECLQLPFLLGETIHVTTVCPSDGLAIQLTITDQGVTSHDPSGCVMSMMVSGQMTLDEPAQLAAILADPQKLIRQLTRFFSSSESAALWLVAYPNVVILQLDQAWRLAAALADQRSRSNQVEAASRIDSGVRW